MRSNRTTKSKVQRSKSRRRCQHRPFPYLKVAKMWTLGKKIAQIAHSIDRVDKDNPQDPYHSLRNFLTRMHKGYRNGNGRIVKLPHRVSKSTLRAAKKAGLRAW